MAQTAFTTAQIPGGAAVTVPHFTVMGRCPRCERWPWQASCGGISGEPVHLGG